MKNHAQGIIIQAFNLVVSDDALTQWRTKYNILPPEMSNDEVQARILKGLLFELLTDPLLSLSGVFRTHNRVNWNFRP